ncbi:MAG: nickel transporter [Methylocystis sp.]|nr:MAG: nickel transporter [Methylocystis sp.]
MQVIPVIDIRNGAVVRALAGRRSDYRPLVTPLARSIAPLDVARGLMSLHAFEALYIADLDAIEGRGDNRSAILRISEAFPKTRLWIDAGAADGTQAQEQLARWSGDVVLGSESFVDLDALGPLCANARILLSLDFQGERFLGDGALYENAAAWPQRVIAMTLARVGAGEGPDVSRLAEIAARAGGRDIFVAGGVRNLDDLACLEAAGAAGALVASALHDARLTGADLARITEK